MEAAKPKKKSHTVLLLGILAVVVVAAALYFFFFSGSTPVAEEDMAASDGLGEDIIPELKFSVLESDVFNRFKVWGVIPIEVGETGKQNPFGL